ncbi:fucosyl transferase [Dictyocaulus viviparus]|uniref:Fucosyltransferase n=1 Tax=Dictyocaulus viviparus TaxID=29172 RepID=A0A0D8XZP8_DICVI|nr:fucosyl transferase [Dictyocaulus viviparus]
MLKIFMMSLSLIQAVVDIIKDMFLCRWRRRLIAEDMQYRDFLTSVNFFNWTATYLMSSDVVFKYGFYYLSSKEAEEKGFKLLSFYVDGTVPKKKSGIFGLVSNCKTASKREIAFKELSRYMNVTIGGKCALNYSTINICPLDSDCLDLFGQYPFYFAVENSVCKDYITEKYWSRTLVPSIPIVMRRRIYETNSMPPHSFIAMDDYASPKEMAEHLINLESNKLVFVFYAFLGPFSLLYFMFILEKSMLSILRGEKVIGQLHRGTHLVIGLAIVGFVNVFGKRTNNLKWYDEIF